MLIQESLKKQKMVLDLQQFGVNVTTTRKLKLVKISGEIL